MDIHAIKKNMSHNENNSCKTKKSEQQLLDIENLNISFDTKKVVQNLSFSIKQGEVFCLVGESGSGKSLTALSILKLLPENAKTSVDTFTFLEKDLTSASEKQMCSIRGSEISMIFQEPMTSLNPVIRVGEQVMEVLKVHKKENKKEMQAKCTELFKRVGISPERMRDYPHQLSGGMRQRVMIAMALACEPKLLIADEPSTALDVTIQGQILNLLKKLVQEQNMGLLLITHDLGVVSEIADTVGVMYAGELMECAPVNAFFQKTLHPYAKSLMKCMPALMLQEQRFHKKKLLDTQNTQEIMQQIAPQEATEIRVVETQVPETQATETQVQDVIRRKIGAEEQQGLHNSAVDFCSFYERCPEKIDACKKPAQLHSISIKDSLHTHLVRCHLFDCTRKH